MRSWLMTLVLVAAVGAGFVFGRVSAPRPSAPRVVRAEAMVPSELGRRAGDDDVAAAILSLRAEVRALRDELHERAPQAQPAAPPAPAPAEPAEAVGPTPEQDTAHESARRLVARAARIGHWTQSDVLALRGLTPSLTPDQLRDVLTTLGPALNSGAIKVDFQGPPL
jgi:hypothetical protein